MTLGNEEYRELARALLATRPEEIDCDQWLEVVVRGPDGPEEACEASCTGAILALKGRKR